MSGAEVKLFPLTHEGVDLKPAEIKLTATSKLPKGKAETLKLETKDGVISAQVDFKSAYRVEVVVEVNHQGKKSSFKFQVEK